MLMIKGLLIRLVCFLAITALPGRGTNCLQAQSQKINPSEHATDWLIDGSSYIAEVVEDSGKSRIEIRNGLISRTFTTSPNAATIGFDNLITSETVLRGIKPEAKIAINGQSYEVGGLKGQPNYAFFKHEWLEVMKANPSALQFVGYELSKPIAPFAWKTVRHHAGGSWPPKGVHLKMDYTTPGTDSVAFAVSVHYELYDGLPLMSKWITVNNKNTEPIRLDSFTSEILAAVEYGSAVESREYQVNRPNIHVETDYAFASFNVDDANHHVVKWLPDPDYHTQVNYQKLTPCLLMVGPEVGPGVLIEPGETFQSFRTFVMLHDSYDRERNGLALRRMYRTLAPWITENPLMMHARFADWEQVKTAIDQASEVGFEMVILTFGSGFDIENDSNEYLSKMKSYADYAASKGLEIGGYSLLASRTISDEHDVIMPASETPTFGNSPCIGSAWGEQYFQKLYHFYQTTGFTLLEHDGSYPGDACTSTSHPGHTNWDDSRWTQYQTISKFYQWCRSKGIYLNIPDYYYLTGGSKCGMGYREVNWSLPRAQQVIHTRQNIYDGSWQKTPSMGWMFVPLTEYHGGGSAATIEPLNEHLDHYELMMLSNLGAGVQACYRGPRLYDSEQTRKMVAKTVEWFKSYREVLEGDIIHLRRADGRDLDYWLNVNPGGKDKGMLMVFNPLNEPITKKIKVPLYYTGLTESAEIQIEGGERRQYSLDRKYQIELDISVDGNDYTWVLIR
jgi:hypothetical protein